MESFMGRPYYQGMAATGSKPLDTAAPLPSPYPHGVVHPARTPTTASPTTHAIPYLPTTLPTYAPPTHPLNHTSGGLPYSIQSSKPYGGRSSANPYSSAGHSPLPHSYAPTHSRPPDVERMKGRPLEVTRVGPPHTFSSISSLEGDQTITSRPNTAHAVVSSAAYRISGDPPMATPHVRGSSSGTASRQVSSAHGSSSSSKSVLHHSHHPPTLIKAEEPTTLSAAHFQQASGPTPPSHVQTKEGSGGQVFETATAPVPYAVAKRAEDPYLAERLEESFACIKRVENPYAFAGRASDMSGAVDGTPSVSGEVEIRRQRNEAYGTSLPAAPTAAATSNYSYMNGARKSGTRPPSRELRKETYDEGKLDLALDLSVKTVRQTADSTAPELDGVSCPSPSPLLSFRGPHSASPRSASLSHNMYSQEIGKMTHSHPQLVGDTYPYSKLPRMTPPQFAQLTSQDVNGLPSSSRYSLPIKRPADSSPSWEQLPSKSPKLQPPLGRSKSPCAALSTAHYERESLMKANRHSGATDPGRGIDPYEGSVKKESSVYAYNPVGADRLSPYSPRLQTDTYKQWPSLFKSKSQHGLACKVDRAAVYQSSLVPEAQSDLLVAPYPVKAHHSLDNRYPTDSSAMHSSLPYNAVDYLSNPNYIRNSALERLSGVDYCSSQPSSSALQERVGEGKSATGDRKPTKAPGAVYSPEIRVKTEMELNSSCVPSASVSSASYPSDIVTSPSVNYFIQNLKASAYESGKALEARLNNSRDSSNLMSLCKVSESISENFKKAIDFSKFDRNAFIENEKNLFKTQQENSGGSVEFGKEGSLLPSSSVALNAEKVVVNSAKDNLSKEDTSHSTSQSYHNPKLKVGGEVVYSLRNEAIPYPEPEEHPEMGKTKPLSTHPHNMVDANRGLLSSFKEQVPGSKRPSHHESRAHEENKNCSKIIKTNAEETTREAASSTLQIKTENTTKAKIEEPLQTQNSKSSTNSGKKENSSSEEEERHSLLVTKGLTTTCKGDSQVAKSPVPNQEYDFKLKSTENPDVSKISDEILIQSPNTKMVKATEVILIDNAKIADKTEKITDIVPTSTENKKFSPEYKDKDSVARSQANDKEEPESCSIEDPIVKLITVGQQIPPSEAAERGSCGGNITRSSKSSSDGMLEKESEERKNCDSEEAMEADTLSSDSKMSTNLEKKINYDSKNKETFTIVKGSKVSEPEIQNTKMNPDIVKKHFEDDKSTLTTSCKVPEESRTPKDASKSCEKLHHAIELTKLVAEEIKEEKKLKEPENCQQVSFDTNTAQPKPVQECKLEPLDRLELTDLPIKIETKPHAKLENELPKKLEDATFDKKDAIGGGEKKNKDRPHPTMEGAIQDDKNTSDEKVKKDYVEGRTDCHDTENVVKNQDCKAELPKKSECHESITGELKVIVDPSIQERITASTFKGTVSIEEISAPCLKASSHPLKVNEKTKDICRKVDSIDDLSTRKMNLETSSSGDTKFDTKKDSKPSNEKKTGGNRSSPNIFKERLLQMVVQLKEKEVENETKLEMKTADEEATQDSKTENEIKESKQERIPFVQKAKICPKQESLPPGNASDGRHNANKATEPSHRITSNPELSTIQRNEGVCSALPKDLSCTSVRSNIAPKSDPLPTSPAEADVKSELLDFSRVRKQKPDNAMAVVKKSETMHEKIVPEICPQSLQLSISSPSSSSPWQPRTPHSIPHIYNSSSDEFSIQQKLNPNYIPHTIPGGKESKGEAKLKDSNSNTCQSQPVSEGYRIPSQKAITKASQQSSHLPPPHSFLDPHLLSRSPFASRPHSVPPHSSHSIPPPSHSAPPQPSNHSLSHPRHKSPSTSAVASSQNLQPMAEKHPLRDSTRNILSPHSPKDPPPPPEASPQILHHGNTSQSLPTPSSYFSHFTTSHPTPPSEIKVSSIQEATPQPTPYSIHSIQRHIVADNTPFGMYNDPVAYSHQAPHNAYEKGVHVTYTKQDNSGQKQAISYSAAHPSYYPTSTSNSTYNTQTQYDSYHLNYSNMLSKYPQSSRSSEFPTYQHPSSHFPNYQSVTNHSNDYSPYQLQQQQVKKEHASVKQTTHSSYHNSTQVPTYPSPSHPTSTCADINNPPNVSGTYGSYYPNVCYSSTYSTQSSYHSSSTLPPTCKNSAVSSTTATSQSSFHSNLTYSSTQATATTYPANHPPYTSASHTSLDPSFIGKNSYSKLQSSVPIKTPPKASLPHEEIKSQSYPHRQSPYQPFQPNISQQSSGHSSSTYPASLIPATSSRGSCSSNNLTNTQFPSVARAVAHHSRYSSPSHTKDEPQVYGNPISSDIHVPINLSSQSHKKTPQQDLMKSPSPFHPPTQAPTHPSKSPVPTSHAAKSPNLATTYSLTSISSSPYFTRPPSNSLYLGKTGGQNVPYPIKSPVPVSHYSSKTPIPNVLYSKSPVSGGLHSAKSPLPSIPSPSKSPAQSSGANLVVKSTPYQSKNVPNSPYVTKSPIPSVSYPQKSSMPTYVNDLTSDQVPSSSYAHTGSYYADYNQGFYQNNLYTNSSNQSGMDPGNAKRAKLEGQRSYDSQNQKDPHQKVEFMSHSQHTYPPNSLSPHPAQSSYSNYLGSNHSYPTHYSKPTTQPNYSPSHALPHGRQEVTSINYSSQISNSQSRKNYTKSIEHLSSHHSHPITTASHQPPIPSHSFSSNQYPLPCHTSASGHPLPPPSHHSSKSSHPPHSSHPLPLSAHPPPPPSNHPLPTSHRPPTTSYPPPPPSHHPPPSSHQSTSIKHPPPPTRHPYPTSNQYPAHTSHHPQPSNPQSHPPPANHSLLKAYPSLPNSTSQSSFSHTHSTTHTAHTYHTPYPAPQPAHLTSHSSQFNHSQITPPSSSHFSLPSNTSHYSCQQTTTTYSTSHPSYSSELSSSLPNSKSPPYYPPYSKFPTQAAHSTSRNYSQHPSHAAPQPPQASTHPATYGSHVPQQPVHSTSHLTHNQSYQHSFPPPHSASLATPPHAHSTYPPPHPAHINSSYNNHFSSYSSTASKPEPTGDSKIRTFTPTPRKQPLKENGQLLQVQPSDFTPTNCLSHPPSPSKNKSSLEAPAQMYSLPEVKLEPVNHSLLPKGSSTEPGKAALAEKLQKKPDTKDSLDKGDEEAKNDNSTTDPNSALVDMKVEENVGGTGDVEEIDELDQQFDKLLDDLALHKDAVTSKKSRILGRRYYQKVQLQNAVDNNEVVAPETFLVEEEEDDDESEREEPVKKFRGKFRSIKDKAVERLILTYASHSDESATEMIPDEDASDFEEQLIKEIEAKARKGKARAKAGKHHHRTSSAESANRDKGDHNRKKGGAGNLVPSVTKEKRKLKRDDDFSPSSSYNDSSSSQVSSSSSSSDDDDSSLSSSSASSLGSSDGNAASKRKKTTPKRRACGRSRSTSSSNSDDDFLPKRKTRRSKKLSSDDSFSPDQRRKKAKNHRKDVTRDLLPGKRKLRKRQKQDTLTEDEEEKGRRKKRFKEEDNSDTEENYEGRKVSTTDCRKKGSLKMKLVKKRTVSTSEEDDEDEEKKKKSKNLVKKTQQSVDSDSDDPSSLSAKKTIKKPNVKKILDSESEEGEETPNGKKKTGEEQELEQVEVQDESASSEDDKPEEVPLILLNNTELLFANPNDSVLLKLNKQRQEELSRDDVIEMQTWREMASSEVHKLLDELRHETKLRNTWRKPTFGVDEFRKGWQTEVKKFKTEVARIPKRLITTPPPPRPISPAQGEQKENGSGTLKKGKESSVKRATKGKGSPAKNTRSKSGIVKTSMSSAETETPHKVSARPEISNVMERFFEKVLGQPLASLESTPGGRKLLPAFAPFSPAARSPTGLTPTPSLALSLRASDDSDRDSLINLRTDLPASDSVPVAPRRNSIANSLIKKLRKKYRARRVDTQWLTKTRGVMETTNRPQLLPTPGLSPAVYDGTKDDSKAQLPAATQYEQMQLTTFFRKDSVAQYRDSFTNIVLRNGLSEFTPVLMPPRTRRMAKALLDAAAIKAIFGAAPPPPTDLKNKPSRDSGAKVKGSANTKKSPVLQEVHRKESPVASIGSTVASGTAPHTHSPVPSSVSQSSTPIDFLYHDDDDSEIRSERSETTIQELAIMQGIRKSRKKLRKFRKFRSGFDYIRKKKRAKPEEELLQTSKRRMAVRKRMLWPEESRDVPNEVRSWVINKGLGETVLHKAARLQYHDVVIYCLESSDFNVNVKDNAGYTPLHEACNRGHLDIAQALCAHHAHVNASGFGGMRPLHEAIENGHIELARLLLAYGADPSLSTYAGQSCLALASDQQTKHFVNEFLADLRGKTGAISWHILGPARFFDLPEQGSDIFAEVPTCYPENKGATPCPSSTTSPEKLKALPTSYEQVDKPKDSAQDLHLSEGGEPLRLDPIIPCPHPSVRFEISDCVLPTVYTVYGREGRYVLLKELLDHLSMTRKELILSAGSIETLHLSPDDFDKKLKSLVIGYKVTRKFDPKNNVTLVKYSARIQELLGVEVVCVDYQVNDD